MEQWHFYRQNKSQWKYICLTREIINVIYFVKLYANLATKIITVLIPLNAPGEGVAFYEKVALF